MSVESIQNANVRGVKKPAAIVVNLFAGPGAGKSTTASGLFTLLKLHNVECELVTEFAKDLVWEERYRTFDNQFYLFGKQQHRIWRVADKVNLIITDSPILLSNVYGNLFKRSDYCESFAQYVLDEHNRYKSINIFIERVKEYKTYGRNQDENDARELDNTIKSYLKQNNIPYFSVYGNWEGINNAFQIVGMHRGYEQKYFLREG